ncbi:MAG: DUF6114 domain-containing protein [Halobacteria archaeon]
MSKVILKPVVKNYRRVDRKRNTFRRWAEKRPFWGALLLIIAGVLLAISPAQTLSMFLFGEGSAKILGIVGLFFALFVFLSGIAAMTQPQLSTLAGLVGIVLSVLSIVGGTEWGALLLGTFAGILGGSLCVAWIQIEEDVVIKEEIDEDEIKEGGEEVEELKKKVEKYEEMLERKEGEDKVETVSEAVEEGPDLEDIEETIGEIDDEEEVEDVDEIFDRGTDDEETKDEES